MTEHLPFLYGIFTAIYYSTVLVRAAALPPPIALPPWLQNLTPLFTAPATREGRQDSDIYAGIGWPTRPALGGRYQFIYPKLLHQG